MVIRLDSSPTPRQRSPRTDPSLRDGDSGHGNPGDDAGDRNALDSDTDTGDTDGVEPLDAGGGPADVAERQTEFADLVEEIAGDGRTGNPEDEGVADMLGDRRPDPVAARAAGRGPDADVPIAGYQKLTVPEVLRRVRELNPRELHTVVEFEKANRNRKTLVARLERLSGKA